MGHDSSLCLMFRDKASARLGGIAVYFFFQAEDGIRDLTVTGVQTCALPISYTYHELKEKTIQELRDIAKGVENQDAVQGYSQLNKEHLLPALCKALGIDRKSVV